MGARGPQKTPLSILAARGSRLAGQRSEPHFTGEIPEPPSFLLPAALEEWERLVGPLTESGVMRATDWTTLAAYAQSFARWKEAEEHLAAEGSVIVARDDKGAVKWVAPSPWVSIGEKHRAAMHRFGSALGLSPASRCNVAAAPAATTSTKARFFEKETA